MKTVEKSIYGGSKDIIEYFVPGNSYNVVWNNASVDIHWNNEYGAVFDTVENAVNEYKKEI